MICGGGGYPLGYDRRWDPAQGEGWPWPGMWATSAQ